MGEPAWPDAEERARLLSIAVAVYDSVDEDGATMTPVLVQTCGKCEDADTTDIVGICIMLARASGQRPKP